MGPLHINEQGCKNHPDTRLNELHLVPQWHWLDEQENILPELEKCEALVHPSTHDGLPNAVCESIASGRPVVVTNVLDHPRLVEEGVNGYLCSPDDPESLALALSKLYQLNHEQRLAMGAAARTFATRELNTSRLSENYVALFEEVLQ